MRQPKGKPQKLEKKVEYNDHDDQEEEDEDNVPGGYNPADYNNLNVTSEEKDLFKYITR